MLPIYRSIHKVRYGNGVDSDYEAYLRNRPVDSLQNSSLLRGASLLVRRLALSIHLVDLLDSSATFPPEET